MRVDGDSDQPGNIPVLFLLYQHCETNGQPPCGSALRSVKFDNSQLLRGDVQHPVEIPFYQTHQPERDSLPLLPATCISEA